MNILALQKIALAESTAIVTPTGVISENASGGYGVVDTGTQVIIDSAGNVTNVQADTLDSPGAAAVAGIGPAQAAVIATGAVFTPAGVLKPDVAAANPATGVIPYDFGLPYSQVESFATGTNIAPPAGSELAQEENPPAVSTSAPAAAPALSLFGLSGTEILVLVLLAILIFGGLDG